MFRAPGVQTFHTESAQVSLQSFMYAPFPTISFD